MSPKNPTCPHCGEEFSRTKGGLIPTHDFPRPCRAVCPGSGKPPKRHAETPLHKDDPAQMGRDFFEQARQELLIYGFACVKELAALSGQRSGEMQCPLCLGTVKYSVAESNGHCAARCKTAGCVNATE